MIRIPHRVAGLDALRGRIATLPASARAAIDPALKSVAEAAAEDARATLQAEARRGPSRPGAPPRDGSGRLAASVMVAQDGRGSVVTVTAPFAAYLEYGTARMAARPFLRPAGFKAGASAIAMLAPALRKGLSP